MNTITVWQAALLSIIIASQRTLARGVNACLHTHPLTHAIPENTKERQAYVQAATYSEHSKFKHAKGLVTTKREVTAKLRRLSGRFYCTQNYNYCSTFGANNAEALTRSPEEETTPLATQTQPPVPDTFHKRCKHERRYGHV